MPLEPKLSTRDRKLFIVSSNGKDNRLIFFDGKGSRWVNLLTTIFHFLFGHYRGNIITFFFLNQQFITRGSMADRGSYFVTTYIKAQTTCGEKKEKEKKGKEKKKKRKKKKSTK